MRATTRAEAHAIAALMRVALRVLPLPRIVTLLARLPRAQQCRDGIAECELAATEAARRAAHPTCLFTALVAFALLVRRGYLPCFMVGVSRDHGFDAHAWVTVDGVALIPSVGEYAPLWSSGASSTEAI